MSTTTITITNNKTSNTTIAKVFLFLLLIPIIITKSFPLNSYTVAKSAIRYSTFVGERLNSVKREEDAEDIPWHQSENINDNVDSIDPEDVDEWWEDNNSAIDGGNNKSTKSNEGMIRTHLAASKKAREELEKKYGSNPELKLADVKKHLQRQTASFDEMAEFFDSEQALLTEDGEDVRPLLRQIARRALRTCIESRAEGRRARGEEDAPVVEEEYTAQDIKENIMYIGGTNVKIVDVGCGTGALFEYYLEAAQAFGVCLDITAFDISKSMVSRAEKKAKNLLQSEKYDGNGHRINIVNADFVSSVLDRDEEGRQSEYFGKHDAVIINSCFGNFFSTGK